MFKIQKYLLCIPVVVCLLIASLAHASDVQINAGLLKNIWYSNTDVYEGDNIKIFGGIYNQSEITFSGIVVTYIDNKEINREKFVSKPDSLFEIFSKWTTEKGRFSVQIVLVDIIFNGNVATSSQSTNSLLSSETDKGTLSVGKKITLEEVKKTVQNVAVNIIETIDNKTEELSEKILTLQKPVDEKHELSDTGDRDSIEKTIVAKSGSLDTDVSGQVLGADTKFESVTGAGMFSKIKNSNFVTNIYNKIIFFLSLIIKYWKITLFAVIILILIFKFLI